MRFAGFLFLLFAIPGASLSQIDSIVPKREWTSDDGNTIRASVVGFDDEGAVLRLDTGRRVTVPESRFSLPDQAILLRARLQAQTWSELSEPIDTRFYFSLHTKEGGQHEGLAPQVASGPKRFNFSVRIHSTECDFTEYDTIIVTDGEGHEYANEYDPKTIASWERGSRTVSRAGIGISDRQGGKLIPILSAGLRNGRLEFFAAKEGKERFPIPISESERKAMADMLQLYLLGAPLVSAGVIGVERLDKHPIGESSVAQPAEDSLSRFRTMQGGGRFGDILWTPEAGEPVVVAGLGWVRDEVVIRKPGGEVAAVPLGEIAADSRQPIFTARIDEFAGKKEFERDGNWIRYNEQSLEGNARLYQQAILLDRHEETGEPRLVLRAYTVNLEGRPLTSVGFRSENQRGETEIPLPVGATILKTDGDKKWSILNYPLPRNHADSVIEVADTDVLNLRLVSGDDDLTIPLQGDSLSPSLEAIDLYRWSLLLPRK